LEGILTVTGQNGLKADSGNGFFQGRAHLEIIVND
jgi:hypothetical protein